MVYDKEEHIRRSVRTIDYCISECDNELAGREFDGHRVNTFPILASYVDEDGNPDQYMVESHNISNNYFNHRDEEYVSLSIQAGRVIRERTIITDRIIREVLEMGARISEDDVLNRATLIMYAFKLDREGRYREYKSLSLRFRKNLNEDQRYRKNIEEEKRILTEYKELLRLELSV